jgi:hypothetical protein
MFMLKQLVVFTLLSIIAQCEGQSTITQANTKSNTSQIFTIDSINVFCQTKNIENISYIDSSLIGISTSFIPNVFVANEEGNIIFKRSCNADFPNFLSKNHKEIRENKVFTSEFSIPLINNYIKSTLDSLNGFNIIWFLSFENEYYMETVQNYLSPLLLEAEKYSDVSVYVIFSDHHNKLGLTMDEFRRAEIRNSFLTLKDFDRLPSGWKSIYGSDTLMLQGLYQL